MSKENKISNSLIVLGRLLIERGIIDELRWKQLLAEAMDSDDILLSALSSEGAGSETELMNIVSKELKVPFIELDCYIIDPALCKIIPSAIIFSQTILPIHRTKDFLTLAMADPANTQAIEDVEFMLGLKVKPILALSRDIKKIIEEAFKDELIADKPFIDGWYDGNENDEQWHCGPEPTAESLASRLFNLVLQRIASNETDCIHIKSRERELDIIEIKNGLPSQFASGSGPLKIDSPDIREVVEIFISKFKIISNSAIDEERLPQETGAVIKYQNKNHFIKMKFSKLEDGEGLLIEIRRVL